MIHNRTLAEQTRIVIGLAPVTPSSASPRWVSLKNYERLTIIITVANGTTVTGSAIALSQATDVAGTGAKTVAFTSALRNENAATTDALTAFDVTSNTFTTLTTNSRQLVYVIEVTPDMLDLENGFDCVRVTVGNGANMVLAATYILGPARYSGAALSAITN